MTFQIGSVLLDACVLAILAKEDTYGYRLTQQIKETLGVSEPCIRYCEDFRKKNCWKPMM